LPTALRASSGSRPDRFRAGAPGSLVGMTSP
jgi:hypothetical protein